MQPHTSYLVCGTPRSGSSLLCEALTNSTIAGKPKEYYLPRNEAMEQEQWGTPTYAAYLAETITRGTTANGVFGAKMMWGYFDLFIKKVRELPANKETASIPHLLETVFPNLHYIWIKRRDKVRQAVSHAKARQTDIWKITPELVPQPANMATFSFEQIDFMVHELEAQDKAWQKYFTSNSIKPFVVLYEDFVLNYEETAIQILKYLKLPGAKDIQFAPRLMKKQADEESEQWVQRYYQFRTQRKQYWMISFSNRQLQMFLQTTKLGRLISSQRMDKEIR